MTEPDLSHIAEDLRPLAVPITEIVKDPANLRLHNDKSLEGVRGSLAKFTQRKNVVVNRRTGVIEAGNGTVEALIRNGKTHVAVVWVDDDPVTATAYAIADNRTAELSTWDTEALVTTAKAIDFEVPGVDDEWLDSLGVPGVDVPAPGQGDDEQEPEVEVPSDPVSVLGQVYQLGPHRLLCGDCSRPEDWALLLGGERATVIVTSPPYASQREYDEDSEFKPIPPDKYGEWWAPIQANMAAFLSDDGSYFLNLKEHCEDGQRHLYVKKLTIQHVEEWGWQFVDEYVWTHGGTPKGPKRRFKNGWEPIFHFVRQYEFKWRPDNCMRPAVSTENQYWFGSGFHPNLEEIQKYGHTEGMARKGVVRPPKTQADLQADVKAQLFGGKNVSKAQGKGKGGKDQVKRRRKKAAKDKADKGDGPPMAYPSNVLSLGKNSEALGHSAAFPIKLPSFCMKACSDEGDIVLDPFMGSGTTLIAAAKLNRRGFGMEISPAYCDVIRKRWGDYARKNDLEPGEHAL